MPDCIAGGTAYLIPVEEERRSSPSVVCDKTDENVAWSDSECVDDIANVRQHICPLRTRARARSADRRRTVDNKHDVGACECAHCCH